MLGMACRVGIDNEKPVEPLVDMPFQRQRVTVIEMAAERLGIELIDELLARIDHTSAGDTVHARGVDAVKMDRMGLRVVIAEDDLSPFTFGCSQRRAGHLAIVGPGRKHDAGRDLDFFVDGFHDEGVLCPPIGKIGNGSGLPLCQHLRRVEPVPRLIDVADRHHRAVAGSVTGLMARTCHPLMRLAAGISGLIDLLRTAHRGDSGPACGRKARSHNHTPAQSCSQPVGNLEHSTFLQLRIIWNFAGAII